MQSGEIYSLILQEIAGQARNDKIQKDYGKFTS